jgi:ATP-dependent Lon protease
MAGLAVNGPIDAQQYIAVVERTEELVRLQAQTQRRKSMLIFGPEAVGKTRLLRSCPNATTRPFCCAGEISARIIAGTH